MSENPGPASPGTPAPGDEQRDTPVDTGTGPNEADLNQEPTAASDDEEGGRPGAG